MDVIAITGIPKELWSLVVAYLDIAETPAFDDTIDAVFIRRFAWQNQLTFVNPDAWWCIELGGNATTDASEQRKACDAWERREQEAARVWKKYPSKLHEQQEAINGQLKEDPSYQTKVAYSVGGWIRCGWDSGQTATCISIVYERASGKPMLVIEEHTFSEPTEQEDERSSTVRLFDEWLETALTCFLKEPTPEKAPFVHQMRLDAAELDLQEYANPNSRRNRADDSPSVELWHVLWHLSQQPCSSTAVPGSVLAQHTLPRAFSMSEQAAEPRSCVK